MAFLIGIAAIVGVVFGNLEKYHKFRKELDKEKENITEALDKAKALEEEFMKSHDTYEKRFDKLDATDERLFEKLTQVSECLSDMEKYNKQRDLSDLKDKILRNYYQYHAQGYITESQMETLTGLIDSYTQAGGNSFVHSKILPEIKNWEVIPDSFGLINNEKA